MGKHLATAARKNSLLMGRNLEQNGALGGLVWLREEKGGKGREKENEKDTQMHSNNNNDNNNSRNMTKNNSSSSEGQAGPQLHRHLQDEKAQDYEEDAKLVTCVTGT